MPEAGPTPSGNDAATTTEPEDDAGSLDGASMSPDRFDGLRPQTNVSFDTALRLRPGSPPHLQDERSADQVDYYVFRAEAGAFYEITTDAGRFAPNNVLQLFDSQRRPIAENNHGSIWPGDGIDARLVVRTPTDGDYYLTVEDRRTPASFFEREWALLYYHVVVRPLTDETPGVAIAIDQQPVDVEFARDMGSEIERAVVLADPQLGARVRLRGRRGHALLGRTQTSESDVGPLEITGVVRVTDASDLVVSESVPGAGRSSFNPPVDQADYQLLLSPFDGAPPTAFVAIDLTVTPDNPPEQDELGNDSQSGAEPLTLDGDLYRRGFVVLRLPPKDVDYFAIPVIAGEYIQVACEGESAGSGVRGLRAQLLHGEEVLAHAGEEPGTNLNLRPVQIPDTSTLHLRVWTDPAVEPGAAEPWARCSLVTGP